MASHSHPLRILIFRKFRDAIAWRLYAHPNLEIGDPVNPIDAVLWCLPFVVLCGSEISRDAIPWRLYEGGILFVTDYVAGSIFFVPENMGNTNGNDWALQRIYLVPIPVGFDMYATIHCVQFFQNRSESYYHF